MKTLLIGVGAAGNKAVYEAVNCKLFKETDTVIINSTSKDFPKDYKGNKIILSPNDTGCGKERSAAKEYVKLAIKAGKLNIENISNYDTIIICTSVEGGTGSGSTPIIAQYFKQVANKNVHVVAFTGFEEDVRGLANTVEFFQELDKDIVVQTISNASFLEKANNNKFKAEELADKEMCTRIRVFTGMDFIESEQNIDDTDINKVSNTTGYMTVEYKQLRKPLEEQEDFNKVIKNMIYNSHSIKSNNPGAIRTGVILNISPESVDAIDYSFTDIYETYGKPYENFLQKQWDGKKEYIAFIISGMNMPLDEVKGIYERYKEASEKVNKEVDKFNKEMNSLSLNEEDEMFNMLKSQEKGMSTTDFLSQFDD
jgi:cell division GTPase FtsZ